MLYTGRKFTTSNREGGTRTTVLGNWDRIWEKNLSSIPHLQISTLGILQKKAEEDRG